MKRRTFITTTVSAAMLAAWHGSIAGAPGGRTQVSAAVTGGKRGRPFASYPNDLARLGYVEEEFFVSGEATNYRLTGDFTRDSKWAVTPNQRKPFQTRILVHRPRDPARFNGTVLVEWINVSPGNDNLLVPDDPIYEGFAYVGVSAQYVGVHGFPNLKPAHRNGLTAWDPVRYKTLAHPGDSHSYDIFSQVGRVLKNRDGGVDPLGGLTVRKLIATGASQSAGRLRTYVNAVHPLAQVYDAFVPFLDFANAVDFDDKITNPDLPPEQGPRRIPARFRDDLNVPVLVVNTEQESINFRGERGWIMQPDTDRFRLWEVAGTPHSPAVPTIRAAIGRRDLQRETGDGGRSAPPPAAPTTPPAHVTSWHCTIAALYHVHGWINGGPPPPHQNRLRYTDRGTALVRDSLGIATGGIRLPETEVPIEMNTGLHENVELRTNRGVSAPFSPDVLARLYPSHEEYVSRVTAAALASESAGVIRRYRVEQYTAAAKTAQIPPASARPAG